MAEFTPPPVTETTPDPAEGPQPRAPFMLRRPSKPYSVSRGAVALLVVGLGLVSMCALDERADLALELARSERNLELVLTQNDLLGWRLRQCEPGPWRPAPLADPRPRL